MAPAPSAPRNVRRERYTCSEVASRSGSSQARGTRISIGGLSECGNAVAALKAPIASAHSEGNRSPVARDEVAEDVAGDAADAAGFVAAAADRGRDPVRE